MSGLLVSPCLARMHAPIHLVDRRVAFHSHREASIILRRVCQWFNYDGRWSVQAISKSKNSCRNANPLRLDFVNQESH
jgi:hypothetical protein